LSGTFRSQRTITLLPSREPRLSIVRSVIVGGAV
jgi:hypothetical protein